MIGGRITSRTMTVGGVVLGILVVVNVAVVQLAPNVTGALSNPAIAYPAAVLHDDTLGSEAAPVTLEVYDDFQCPVCAQHSLNVEPSLVSKYVVPGKLRIVHHDIAILGGKPTEPNNESRIAASGAVCAVAQGKYWDYAHWVYGNQTVENGGEFTRDRLASIAKAAGLDPIAFRACLDESGTTSQVDAATQKAIGMGINTTPAFYMGGQLVASGLKSVSELSTLIDAALAKASASPAASPGAAASSGASASPGASGSTTP
ncbi:MAG TPA: thioredoxin domain-containing protein [Candidatus Limnocylindrales bacterium]